MTTPTLAPLLQRVDTKCSTLSCNISSSYSLFVLTWIFVLFGYAAPSMGQGAGPDLNAIRGILAGIDGQIYVTDIHSTGTVFRIDPLTGDRTIIAGQGVGSGPEILSPYDIVQNANGQLFVADRHEDKNAIIQIDPQTGVRTVFSDSLTGFGPNLALPTALAISPDGTLYATSIFAGFYIMAIDSTGNRTIVSDINTGTGPAVQSGYIDVGLDGNIIVPSFAVGHIISVDPISGNRTFLSPSDSSAGPPLSRAWGLAIEDDGNIIVVDSDINVNTVFRVDQNTGFRTVLTDSLTGLGPVSIGPVGVDVDQDGGVLITTTVNTDPRTPVIMRVDPVTGNRQLVSSVIPITPGTPGDPIVVNSTSDAAVALDGLCTLREAINNANADADFTGGDCNVGFGADRIEFNIPGSGVQTITLENELPLITQPVSIDGYTQPGSQGATAPGGVGAELLVALNSASIGTAIRIENSNTLLRGLFIDGITVLIGNIDPANCSSHTIEGNRFSNAEAGIIINCSDTVIGGVNNAAGNVFDNLSIFSILLQTESSGIAILGNRFIATPLPISFNSFTVVPNDSSDADPGINNLQNFPDIRSAAIDEEGDLLISYAVDTDRQNAAYSLLIEFYQADSLGIAGDRLLVRDTYSTPGRTKFLDLGSASEFNIAEGDRIITTATDQNGNTSQFSASTDVLLEPQEADLALATDLTNYAEENGTAEISFRYTITNNGPASAEAIVLDDGLSDAGVQFGPVSPSAGTYDEATGTWTINALEDGESVTIDITIFVDTPVTLNNPVQIVSSSVNDPDTMVDNEAEISVSPEMADLELDIEELEIEVETINSGKRLAERVLVRKRTRTSNRGPGSAGRQRGGKTSGVQDGIEVLFTVPEGFRLLPETLELDPADVSAYDDEARIWRIDSLAADSEATISLRWEWIIDSFPGVTEKAPGEQVGSPPFALLGADEDVVFAGSSIPISAEIIYPVDTDPDSQADDSKGDDFAVATIPISRILSTDIEPETPVSIVSGFMLEPNYPNPFTTSTTIPVEMSQPEEVSIKVYDVLGREVEALYEGLLPMGKHEITWYPQGLASGMYLVRMNAGGESKNQTMVLVQ